MQTKPANSPIGNENALAQTTETLTEIRSVFRRQSEFYRKRLPKEEEALILETCRTSPSWSEFLIFAIWHHTERDRHVKPY